jgi:hypothetical protein
MKKITLLFLCLASNLGANTKQYHSTISEITPSIKQRLRYSWREDSPIPFKDLRYITITHWGFDDATHQGELIMHSAVAEDITAIFGELFALKFPITQMRLVDEFKGDDDTSMQAGNTYAHCARPVARTTAWSNHAYGLAIDINPHINPYIERRPFGVYVCPGNNIYLDRSHNVPGMITRSSAIYSIFKKYGFEWAGESLFYCQDLHHFQKIIPGLNKTVNYKKNMEVSRTTFFPRQAHLYEAPQSKQISAKAHAGELFVVSALECDDNNTMWLYGKVQGADKTGWVERSSVNENIGI